MTQETLAPRKLDQHWRRVGLAVAAVGWGANQFAPLLPMYRAELGLSAATTQATFGLYAAGLIPGLLVGGPLSDRYGRRRVLLPALAASVLASALLLAGGSGLGWLLAGRLVAGIASGAAFSAGAAWIKELSALGAPEGANPGARRTTVAMTAGFGIGPLAAGLLAQWAPAHTVLPYLPHLALAATAAPLLSRVPETRFGGAPAARRSPAVRLSPAGRRRFMTVVVPLAPWVFGSATVALAYLPGLVAARLAGHTLAFSAVVTALPAFAGIAVQPLARRAGARLVPLAMGTVVAGLLIASAAAEAPGLIAAASVVLGAGYGCCQVAGLLEVQRLAPPERLAQLAASYQALSYLGFAVPYLLAAAQGWLAPGALLLVTAGCAALTLLWLSGTGRRSAARPRPTA